MTDREVLIKAIEKAIEYGLDETNNFGWQLDTLKIAAKIRDNGSCGTRDDNQFHINEVVFHHDFAKAFWDEMLRYDRDWDKAPAQIAWKFHLQQMVLQENPINYLKQFI